MAKNTSSKTPLLIVEDDEAWVASLTAKLKGEYALSHFASGEEAIQNLLAIKPKVIVLDYHLQGQMTGDDTLKEIKRLLPNTRVIMFSAQDDVQTALNIIHHGAYDYVVKGENATNRLKIILRNLQHIDDLEHSVITIKLKFKRQILTLWALIAAILVVSMIIYLNTCPKERSIKWDPFGIEEGGFCRNYDESTGIETLQQYRDTPQNSTPTEGGDGAAGSGGQ
jgi:CheY-like chemotaxis protein